MNRTGHPGRAGLRARTATVFFTAFFLAAASADAASIRGRVVDPDGRPVPGARVVVSGATPAAIERRTGESGEFEIDSLPAGRHELRVAAGGFLADPAVVELSGDAVREVHIALRVSAVSESVVVSAGHVDLPLSQTAASVAVLEGADLRARQIRTLADALRLVPGLSVNQSGGLGSLTSLFPRGGESDFTLVLLDGVRLNAFGGGLDLSQVPLVNAERVEIVRGPQSAVFGSDAIGGVVQIVSRRDGRPFAEGAAEAGTLGTIRMRAATAGGASRLMWNAQAERASSDGYTGLAPATGERVGNDDARLRHLGLGLGWSGATGAEIRGTAQLSSTDRGFPGPFGSNPIGAYSSVDRVSRGENDRRHFGVVWAQPWFGAGSRVRQRTDVAVANHDSNFTSRFGVSESDMRRLSFRTQADAALAPAFGISAGVEVQRERAGSTFITGGRFEPVPVKRTVTGLFGEGRYAPTTRLSAAIGVRMEQIRRDALEASPSAFAPRPAFEEESIVSVNPKASLAYVLRGASGIDATRLHVSAGTGIRPPDAFEIAFTDNPGLKPERSRSVELGIQQAFAAGRVVADAIAFWNDYDDLIVAVGRSMRDASRYRTDNISNARARGVELSAGVRPIAAVDLRATYTLLETEILSVDRVRGAAPSPYHVGDRLIRRPRHKGSVSAVYAGSRVTAFAESVFRGGVRDIEPSFGAFGGVFDAPGYTSLDAGAAVRAVRLVEIFARVENVTDRRYEEAFGFPAPGRTFMAGLRVAAGR